MRIVLTILVALSVLGGIYLALGIYKGKPAPLSAAKIHGIIGLLLITSIGYSTYHFRDSFLWVPFALAVITALGGLYLYNNHKKGKPGPVSAMLIHVLFGVAAIIILLLTIF